MNGRGEGFRARRDSSGSAFQDQDVAARPRVTMPTSERDWMMNHSPVEAIDRDVGLTSPS
jgi:hypothetical protein